MLQRLNGLDLDIRLKEKEFNKTIDKRSQFVFTLETFDDNSELGINEETIPG